MPDPPTLPLLQSTPVKPKLAVLRAAQGQPELKGLRKDIDTDMRGLWAGFLTPQEFMDTFLDKTSTSPPAVEIPHVDGKPEDKMYGPVLKAVLKLCPNLPIYVTAHARHKQSQFRPDGGVAEHPWRSMAGSGLVEAEATNAPPKEENKSSVGSRATNKASAEEEPAQADTQLEHVPFDWHTHGLMFEFKSKSKQDPFYSYKEATALPEPTIAKPDDESCQTLGQLAHYAAELLNHQHRTHSFQILICGNTARFIYWDRAGAVVSESFNFRSQKDKKLLPEFVWRYQHMSASRRGWDETALEPSTEDVEAFRTHVEQLLANMKDPSSPQRHIAHAEDTMDDSYPPYKLVVNADMVGRAQTLIVQRPIEVVLSPTGRATRGYIAWSVTEKRLVFLKDSWRIQIDGLDKEDNIYATLIEAKVPGLPTVICAGDVKVGDVVQKTRAQDIARSKDLKRMIPSSKSRMHFHHRVVQELAYSLATAVDSKEYIVAFRDAFRTLEKAHDAGILHRDISFNNIMLDANGKVVVNDWDHACVLVRPVGRPIKMFRTGTWLFMSIALLKDSRKEHDLLDDYESLLWSMLFGALKFIKGDIKLNLSAFYEQSPDTGPDGLQIVGGGKKSELLLHGLSKLPFDSTPLAEIFNDLATLWRNYYIAKDAFVSRPHKAATRDTYESLQSGLLASDSWYSILDDHVTNTEGWQKNDLIKDRYPMTSEKVINIELKKQAFSKLMSMEAHVTQSMQCDSGRGTSSDSPLSSLPDGYAAPQSVGIHDASLPQDPPGPPASAIDSVSSSRHGSDSSPSINVNRKRTLSLHLEDDDDVLSAEPSSPMPQAKRVKKDTQGGAASGSASSSERPRTRTRSDPPVPIRKSTRPKKPMPVKSALH